MVEIFRYMSTAEKQSLESGVKVYNHIDWSRFRGTASTSKGFTFGFGGLETAISRSRQLKGIVYAEWLMVAEVPDEQIASAGFKQCRGRYMDYRDIPPHNPTNYTEIPSEYVTELCVEEYSKECFTKVSFRPVLGVDRFSLNFIIGPNKVASKAEKITLNLCNQRSDFDRARLSSLFMQTV